MPTGTVKVYDSSGNLIRIEGYDSASRLSYVNLLNSNGTLIEQDGYDTSGNKTIAIVHAADGGETISQWNAAGQIIAQTVYDASGTVVSTFALNADGTSTRQTFVSGHVATQAGYDAQGHETYANSFNAAGTLIEQDGYDSAGNKIVAVVTNADGSSAVTLWTSAGRVTEQDTFQANGKIASSYQLFADGSTQTTTYSAGIPTTQSGHDSSGRLSYTNTFGPSGTLIEQDGYDTSGNKTIAIVHAADGGETISQWNAAGQIIAQTVYDASGTVVSTFALNADGTSTRQTFVSGHVATQAGYDAQGHETYANSFNAAGTLIEQDGYDSAGNKIVAVVTNADGSSAVTLWTSAGRVTEQDTFQANGKIASSYQLFADGSTQTTTFSAGIPTTQSGHDSSGRLSYMNTFGPSGTLIEQDGYDTSGNKTIAIVHAADGGETISQWNAAGLLFEKAVYDASGAILSTLTTASDGTSQRTLFAGGVTTEVDGYSASGSKVWTNLYSHGSIVEQVAFAPNGIETYSLKTATDGSQVLKQWDSTGRLLELDQIANTGVALISTTYAADGNYGTVLRSADGHTVQTAGYTKADVIVFNNKYDSTGHVAEQDGYSSTGQIHYSVVTNSDGTANSTLYNDTGAITETSAINNAGIATKTVDYAVDGSTTVKLSTDAGATYEVEGLTAAGRPTYVNIYDPATGNLKEQDGYSQSGTLATTYVTASDGTAIFKEYDSNGTLIITNDYDAQGRVIHTDTPFLGSASFVYATAGATGGATIDLSKFKLTFADDFNSLSASPTAGAMWKTALAGDGRTYSTTGEVEYYSDASVGVNPFSNNNGVLTITANRIAPGQTPVGSGATWTSGVLSTESSFAQEYGYFEMNAQLPTGSGTWPAFWMLPAAGGWPPELDIMEAIGSSATTVYGSTHGGTIGAETTLANVMSTLDISAGFHTYGVDWEPDTITWYIDNIAVASEATPTSLKQPMYVIADLAIGGATSWPGAAAATLTTASMQIDYIRAYASANTVSSGLNLTVNAAQPILVGLAGNDTFTLASGAQSVDGGAGVNTAIVAASWTSVAWTPGTSGGWSMAAAWGNVAVNNIATVTFQDAVVTLGNSIVTAADTNGIVFWKDTFADDSSSLVQWYSSGREIEEDIYNTTHYETQITSFAADGTKTIQLNNSVGVKVELDGYSSSGVKTFSNIYNSTTAMLTEQDGYDSSGNKVQIAHIAADGSQSVTHYTSGGVLTERDTLNVAHMTTSVDTYASDGSNTLVTFNAAGVTIEQDGYSTQNVKTYTNLYDPASGRLTEQDAFDLSGNKIQITLRAVDSSYSVSSYSTSGTLTGQMAYNSSGAKATTTVEASSGYTITGYVDHATLIGTHANDVFTGSGNSETFGFQGQVGTDVVNNFHSGTASGHDILSIDHNLFADYATLMSHTHDVTGGTMITIDGSNSIFLHGVTAASLVAADVIIA